MQIHLSFRRIYLLGLIVSLAALGSALVLQYYFKLDPCPLCALTRLVILLMGLGFLLGLIHNPGKVGARVYGVCQLGLGLAGLAIAARHLWLQSLPPAEAPACGPGLNYILETLPILEALDMIFKGSGECAQIQWQFLGLTLPGWAAVVILLLMVLGMWPSLQKNKPA